MLVEIRFERPGDREQIYRLNCRAFETDTEARLVDALRESADPYVSLVAEAGKRIVGHLLLTAVSVERRPDVSQALGLAPMVVLPEQQRKGIGSQLVRAGLQEASSLGAAAVFVLGHPDYYPRFGFLPAARFDFYYQSQEFDPYFFVLELQPESLQEMSGRVRYHPAFESV